MGSLSVSWGVWYVLSWLKELGGVAAMGLLWVRLLNNGGMAGV